MGSYPTVSGLSTQEIKGTLNTNLDSKIIKSLTSRYFESICLVGRVVKVTGTVEETGEGDGVGGYTINIPLEKGVDESVYIKNFESIIIPSLKKFDPDWIMVSCGFDAHIDDPFGVMKLKSSSYGKFHQLLKSLNKKKMTYILEGGYNTDAIKSSIAEIRLQDLV